MIDLKNVRQNLTNHSESQVNRFTQLRAAFDGRPLSCPQSSDNVKIAKPFETFENLT